MKLRYVHVQGLPPLEDVDITFQQSSVLSKPLAVHFVAGVNGTGKTSLLQAITETFISLARSRATVPFPITIAYDLGNAESRTILLIVPAETDKEPILIEFETLLPSDVDWKRLVRTCQESDVSTLPYAVSHRFTGGNLPGAGSVEAYLPTALLVYTSGSTASWQNLFSTQTAIGGNGTSSTGPDDEVIERSVPWDAWKEYEHLRMSGADPNKPKQVSSFESTITTTRYGTFMSNDQIKLAVCAMALYEFIRSEKLSQIQEQSDEYNKFLEKFPDKGFQELLNEIDWDAPTALNITINFQPERITRAHSIQIYDLIQLANRVRREPDPGKHRLLSFDLQSTISDAIKFKTPEVESAGQAAEAIYQILGGNQATPFRVFEILYEWHQAGLLSDLNFVIKKKKVDDLILYDWLSDGERMFLGRFAIIYLLQDDEDACIIFDEPETHFNDVWKRRLMEIVYRSLGEKSTEVLISTHSVIVLTDVPAPHITLLIKDNEGEIQAATLRTPIFGAEPSDILVNVLDTGLGSGSFSSTLLEKALEREDPTELRELLEIVSPGFWRFRIRQVLDRKDAASN